MTETDVKPCFVIENPNLEEKKNVEKIAETAKQKKKSKLRLILLIVAQFWCFRLRIFCVRRKSVDRL
jgi:hypothetical protein